MVKKRWLITGQKIMDQTKIMIKNNSSKIKVKNNESITMIKNNGQKLMDRK